MLISKRNAAHGKWEYLKTGSLVDAVHKAREMDWEHDKVQVRVHQTGIESFFYTVEPFENCGCSNLLKYTDFFIPSPIEEDLTLT